MRPSIAPAVWCSSVTLSVACLLTACGTTAASFQVEATAGSSNASGGGTGPAAGGGSQAAAGSSGIAGSVAAAGADPTGSGGSGADPGDGGLGGNAGAEPVGGAGGSPAGSWTGIRVSGTGFVDAMGQEFIPRGLGIGEWHNIEAYMLDVSENSDTGGVGETKLRTLLTAAMGQAGADQFFSTWEANIVTAEDAATWASWGANSIRLPINYHAVSSADGTYLEAGFKPIDELVAWSKAQHIYVILDLHAAPGAQNCEEMSDSPDGVAGLWKSPAQYRQWTIDLWKAIAARYANEPAVMGYDIFDEPYDREKDGTFSSGIATLKAMYTDITSAIRTVDTRHILFFEGTDWSQCDGFAGLTPAWDPQMAYAFHKYWDANDTKSIQGCLDLRTSAQRPIWNGETGENTYVWNQGMIALLEGNKVGWNMWTYKKAAGKSTLTDPTSNEPGDNTGPVPTQPYGIVEPPNFGVMTKYLAGGAKPAQADANTIMQAFAANAATSKCTLNADFIKSVFNK